MKTTEKLKAFAICAAIALALLPATMKAQNDTFFRGGFGDNINNRDIDIVYGLLNDPFGEAPTPYGFDPMSGSSLPLGSGLLIMLAAGAGYAIARSKRSLKKTSALLMACLMTLTFTQCGKKLQTITTNGETVSITLNVGNSGRHIIEPGPGYVPITYEVGDVMYVSNGGSYAGKLTCSDDNGPFVGDIVVNNPADDLYFYFLGGLETKDLESGTTSLTVDISDQGSKLPVLSMGRAEYIEGQTTFTCNLTNKCALVEFDLEQVTSWPVKICNMFSVAKIDFANPNITPTGEVDAITLYPLAADFSVNYQKKWAILLPGESKSSVARVTTTNYAGEQYSYYDIEDIPALQEGSYLYNGTQGNNAIAINNTGAQSSKKWFVVSNNGNVVQFSSGNLQYQASSQTWRFAENQWDYVGGTVKSGVTYGNVYETIGGELTQCNNKNVASNYEGWIDLFGWGTWGDGKSPYLASTTASDYTWSTDFIGTIDGFSDWRTLTDKEWEVLNSYAKTNYKVGKGQVHDVRGAIILPDNCVGTYNISNWTVMSDADWDNYAAMGAIFLPAGGMRVGTNVNGSNQVSTGTNGYYWSSSQFSYYNDYRTALYVSVSSGSNALSFGQNWNAYKYYGCNVRLAR